MYFIQFWKSWTIPQQRMFWALASFFILSLLFLWSSDLYFPEPVFAPRNIHQLEFTAFTHHSFRLGTFELQIPADALLIFERTLGGPLKPNPTAGYIFLMIITGGVICLMSIIAVLNRFWFYAGLALFLMLAFSFRLESLLLFGLSNKIPTAAIFFLYGLPAYYFQFMHTGTSFSKRLLAFTVVTGIVGCLIFFFAGIPHPFLFLSASSLIPGTILTVVFICMIAHEILSTLIVVLTRGARQTKSLQHFLIISAIYLVNLILFYMNRKHLLDWNFLPLNLFLFATLSGVLGLWGFRQREPVYAEIIEANPSGVYFYLSLGAMAFGTMGYFTATANDPVIQFIQDVILYSHLGYGFIFLIYVISNFASMLAGNLQVYRVLYKPNAMPYFTFRLAGLIATFTFFAYSNWKTSMHQVYAGYFNAYADYYLPQDTLVADGYYQRSISFALRNYHAHYAIAQIKASRGEGEGEKVEYGKLVDARPIDLAYLNLTRTYERNNDLSDALRILHQGLHDYPKNGRLENEMGMIFAKMNMKDSALRFVNLANASSTSSHAAATNLLGLSAKFKLTVPGDSLMRSWSPENPGLKTNSLALACIYGKAISTHVDPGTDTLPDVYAITALHNYLMNDRNQMDTALITKTIRLARQNTNPYFSDFLLSAAAYSSYSTGQTIQAIHLLRELASSTQEGKYNNVLGLWAMEQGAPDRAVKYFDQALKQDFTSSFFTRAFALTESSEFPTALAAWDSLKLSPDAGVKKTATEMSFILKASPAQMFQMNDQRKYLFLRYKIRLEDDQLFEEVLSSMKDQPLKVLALLDRSKKLDEADETDRAMQTLALTQGLALKDNNVYEEITHLNLLLLTRQQNWTLLSQQMHSGISFAGKYKPYKIYLEAMLEEHAGKNEDALKKFRWLVHANPYFEDAIVESILFLDRHESDKLKVYTTLVEALELNPNSVKLLKIHVVLSARLDFEENVQSSMDKLGVLLSPSAFLRFLKENPKSFEIAPN